jgi:hypothetical protein
LFPEKKFQSPETNQVLKVQIVVLKNHTLYPGKASNKEDEAIKDDGEDQNTVINKYSPELEGNCVQNELIHSCLSNSESRPSYAHLVPLDYANLGTFISRKNKNDCVMHLKNHPSMFG